MVKNLRDQLNNWVAPLVGFAFALLILHQWLSSGISFSEEAPSRLSPYAVRGSAILVNKTPYTLNFEQQSRVVEALNRTVMVGKERLTEKNAPIPFEEVVIYRFDNKADLTLRPLELRGTGLLLDIPELSTSHYFLDASSGELLSTLKSAVGP